MTTPADAEKEKLKKKLLKALRIWQQENQPQAMTFGRMAEIVNDDPKTFKGIFKGASISKASFRDFKTELLEAKIPAGSLTPNFHQADTRAALLTAVPLDVFFVWLGEIPKNGLYAIGRGGTVYVAFGASCSESERPAGLTGASPVYLLTRISGGVRISRNTIEYGAVGTYRTAEDIAEQQARDQAALLEQQRYAAYLANTAIWRNPGTGALMFNGAAITYLGAPVRIAGNGEVFVGNAAIDQLYEGGYQHDEALNIPVATVYNRVAAQNAFQVVGLDQGPFHRRDHATFSHATRIDDINYYAEELYERLRGGGDIHGFTGRALYFRLPGWAGGLGRRHLTVLPVGGRDIQDDVRTALRAALTAGAAPGAHLSPVLRRRWHVTVERNYDSGENINFYANGDIVDDQCDYYAVIGRPTAAAVIGTHDTLLTAASLNARLRW